MLAGLQVQHARVRIDDMGALPFTIAARIEAAVRRAGLGVRARNCDPSRPCRPATRKDGLRRSRLYLPGNEPKYFVNAGLHGPDAIILDLEDSVPAEEKDAARILVRHALAAVDFLGCERMVRINPFPLGLLDIQEVMPAQPDVLLIPKAETPEQVQEVAKAVEDAVRTSCVENAAEDDRSDAPASPWLMPILESALGIEHAFAIATASERNVALTIGLEDYTADLGVVKTSAGDESLYARLRLVNAAHAAGLQAIDSVYSDLADDEGLMFWGQRARALGFEGMGCLHPLQIPIIHQAFAPSREEIEKAGKIVAAFEEARARGSGVVALGSKMIDAPVVQRALKLVQQAKRMGLV